MAKLSNFFYRHDLAICLIWLVLLEFLVFGNITRNSGFYLDDWSMLKIFYFGPQEFFAMAKNYLLEWPLITLRPVQAPFHAALYCLFGMAPFGYHFTAACMDVVAFLLFYLILRDLFGRKDLALIAASIALIDPRHDTNHNWVLCVSVALSQMLTLLSIYMAVLAARKNNTVLKFLSVIPFAIMTWNYELFLPVAVINAAILCRNADGRSFNIGKFFLWGAYYALPVAMLLGFQKFILPMLVTPTIHQIIFDPAEIISTIIDGVLIQLSPFSFGNLYSYIALNAADLFNRAHLISLSVSASVLALLVMAFNDGGENAASSSSSSLASSSSSSSRASTPFTTKQFAVVALCGLVTIVLAYSLFGLNKEYHPAIATIYNRVNTGGSWGGAIVLAASMVWLSGLIKRQVLSAMFLATLACVLVSFYGCVCWCFDKPWIASWITQKNVQSVMKENVSQLAPASSVLLLNCPRYVNWSPVFDGVWDFERMVQITSNDKSMKGSVISDRLVLTRDKVSDIAHSYVAGVFPLESTFLLQPDKRTLTKVESASSFIDMVERDGMKFGLPSATIAKWRQGLQSAK
jgi:hypothetical protein